MGDPSHSLIAQSGIKFKLKADGDNYNEEIMLFFNFLIDLSAKEDYNLIYNEKLVNDLRLDHEKNLKERKLPLSKLFEKDMNSFFSLIED